MLHLGNVLTKQNKCVLPWINWDLLHKVPILSFVKKTNSHTPIQKLLLGLGSTLLSSSKKLPDWYLNHSGVFYTMEFASHIEKNVCTTSADRTIAMYSVLNLVGQYTRWNLTKYNGIQESCDTIFDSKLFINFTFEVVQLKQTLFPKVAVRFL